MNPEIEQLKQDFSLFVRQVTAPLVDRIMYLEARVKMLEGKEAQDIYLDLTNARLSIHETMRGQKLEDMQNDPDLEEKIEVSKQAAQDILSIVAQENRAYNLKHSQEEGDGPAN